MAMYQRCSFAHRQTPHLGHDAYGGRQADSRPHELLTTGSKSQRGTKITEICQRTIKIQRLISQVPLVA
jgi:hypothetical protein